MNDKKFNEYFKDVEPYLTENVRDDVRKLTKLLVDSRKWKGEVARDVVHGCAVAAISAVLGRQHAAVVAKNLKNTGLFRILRKIGDLALPIAYVDLAIDRLIVEKPEAERLREPAKDIILRGKYKATPIIMAACAIYAVAKKEKVKVTQRDIAKALGITEVSIRNHYKEFE